MKHIYRIEICDGMMRETKSGFEMPKVIETITGKYRQLLAVYKEEKACGNTVHFYRDDQLIHFKTI